MCVVLSLRCNASTSAKTAIFLADTAVPSIQFHLFIFREIHYQLYFIFNLFLGKTFRLKAIILRNGMRNTPNGAERLSGMRCE